MSSDFFFPLFPEGGLAGSLITTVAIGIFVSAFFNLRFGWVLSGFIVPGYLAPLIIHKPIVAMIDIIEGICAYFLAYLTSRLYSFFKLTNSFFGKDSFYNTFLSSIFIRVVFSFFLLPSLYVWLSSSYGIFIPYEDHFQSFGIIIIALIANQFWVPGFRKGIIPLAVIILVTYLIMRFGLMEWTNFRISEINYLYDAAYYSLFGSYKSYVILLVTSLISARMSLRYGWEHGGILVASLLALQWYSPLNVILTLFEALLIYCVALGLFRISFFETANISRAREIVLFFSIGYLYKVLLSWFMFFVLPGVKIIDLYGFGYLLSTLIAIKMYNSRMPLRVLSAIVQTSVFGVVLGTIITFFLTFIPGESRFFPEKADMSHLLRKPNYTLAPTSAPKKINVTQGYLSEFIQTRKDQFAEKGTNLYKAPTKEQLYRFDKQLLVPLIQHIQEGASISQLEKLNGVADLFGYELQIFKEADQEYLILAENPLEMHRNYQASFVFRLNESTPYFFQTPYVLKDQNIIQAGFFLFSQLKGFAFIFTEADPETNTDGSANPLQHLNKDSYFHLGAQVILREEKEEPLMLVYLRGFSHLSPLDPFQGSSSKADAFISFSNGAIRESQFTDLQKKLVDELKEESYELLYLSHMEDEEGYILSQTQESQYLSQTKNKELAVLWLSEPMRSLFRDPNNEFLRLSHMKALGIPIQTKPVEASQVKPSDVLSEKALQAFENYVKNDDILYLIQMQKEVHPLKFTYIMDPVTQKSYLSTGDGPRTLLLPLEDTQ